MTAPRFSPDGQKIVLSVHNESTGGEDIWLIRLNGEAEVLVADGSMNLTPSWSSDGSEIYFSSDRTGASNIFSFDLKSRQAKRLTNVLGGVFSPVPDAKGEWIYCISYRGKGYDVAKFKRGTSAFSIASRRQLPEPPSNLASPPDTVSRPYSGFKYLSPKYLAPAFQLRSDSTIFGFSTGRSIPSIFSITISI